MTPNEVFLKSTYAFLHGESVTTELSEDEWHQLVKTAHEQKMLPMIFEAAGESMPESMRISCKKQVVRQVAMQARYTAEFLSLYQRLTDAGLSPLVVKGILCRETYEKPDYRMSSDEDVYLPLEEYTTFHEKMQEIGYATKEPDYKNNHEERYEKDGMLIEGHWELFPQENRALDELNELNSGIFKRSEALCIGGIKLRVPEPSDHMIFLLLHAYKHFVKSGVGIRQICDIACWAKKYELDWQRIYDTMCSVRADTFAAAIFDAAEKLCGLPVPEMWERVDSTPLIDDALDGGIYGTKDMSRRHSCSMTLGAVEDTGSDKQGRLLLKSLFPNRGIMEKKYPWLKKSVLLLPAAWCARIVNYISERGEGNSSAESIRIGNERIELLKKYKII